MPFPFYAGTRNELLLEKFIKDTFCEACHKNTEQRLIIYCQSFVLGIFYPIKFWAWNKQGEMTCRTCQTLTVIKETGEKFPPKIYTYFKETKIPFYFRLPVYLLVTAKVSFYSLFLVGYFSLIFQFLIPTKNKIVGKWTDNNDFYQMYVYPDREITVVATDTIVFSHFFLHDDQIIFPFFGYQNSLPLKGIRTNPLFLHRNSNSAVPFKKDGRLDDFDELFRQRYNQWRTKPSTPENTAQIRKKVEGYLTFEILKMEKALELDLDFIPGDPNSPIVLAYNGVQVNFRSVDRWRFLFNNDTSWQQANEMLHYYFPSKSLMDKDEKNAFKRNLNFLKVWRHNVAKGKKEF